MSLDLLQSGWRSAAVIKSSTACNVIQIKHVCPENEPHADHWHKTICPMSYFNHFDKTDMAAESKTANVKGWTQDALKYIVVLHWPLGCQIFHTWSSHRGSRSRSCDWGWRWRALCQTCPPWPGRSKGCSRCLTTTPATSPALPRHHMSFPLGRLRLKGLTVRMQINMQTSVFELPNNPLTNLVWEGAWAGGTDSNNRRTFRVLCEWLLEV